MPERETSGTEYPEPESGLHMLFIDGAKKKSLPGQAVGETAIGGVLKDPEGKTVLDTISKGISPVRGPLEAEYHALIEGLGLALTHKISYIAVFSDSRTLVNQVNNIWERRKHFVELCNRVQEMLATFAAGGSQVSWIPREWNKEAHEQADKALNAPDN